MILKSLLSLALLAGSSSAFAAADQSCTTQLNGLNVVIKAVVQSPAMTVTVNGTAVAMGALTIVPEKPVSASDLASFETSFPGMLAGVDASKVASVEVYSAEGADGEMSGMPVVIFAFKDAGHQAVRSVAVFTVASGICQ